MEKVFSRRLKRISKESAFTCLTLAAAILLPQVLHSVGIRLGVGGALGQIFLPMYLPILILGFTRGMVPGAAAGLLAPLLSFMLTQMPTSAMLPFMMIELCIYGLCAGMLRGTRMPTILKVLIAQLIGRGIRAIAIVTAFYAFGSSIPVAVIWNSIAKGIIGLVLQWSLLPLIVYRVERLEKNEQ